MTTIAGIIPTVGRPEMLRLCLESLCKQSRPLTEVIVVHCGDDAGTPSVVGESRWRDLGLACRYFAYPERNAAAQRNFAVQQTSCDVLMLLDDDVELEPAWVEELSRPIEQDAGVGATMGALVNQPLGAPSWFWRAYRMLAGGARALEPGRLAGAAMPNGFPAGTGSALPTEWIGGGVAAVRRTAFLSVGGFAPYFSGSSPGEDLDLGYRLSRRWQVWFVPAARAIHHAASGGRIPSSEYQYQSTRSRFAILVRAFELSRPRALLQLLLWMVFQAISELAAIRHGLRGNLLAAWLGRARGLASCMVWTPPINHEQPSLFPRAAS